MIASIYKSTITPDINTNSEADLAAFTVARRKAEQARNVPIRTAIKTPDPKDFGPGDRWVLVQAGERLFDIANRYKVNACTLVENNGINVHCVQDYEFTDNTVIVVKGAPPEVFTAEDAKFTAFWQKYGQDNNTGHKFYLFLNRICENTGQAMPAVWEENKNNPTELMLSFIMGAALGAAAKAGGNWGKAVKILGLAVLTDSMVKLNIILSELKDNCAGGEDINRYADKLSGNGNDSAQFIINTIAAMGGGLAGSKLTPSRARAGEEVPWAEGRAAWEPKKGIVGSNGFDARWDRSRLMLDYERWYPILDEYYPDRSFQHEMAAIIRKLQLSAREEFDANRVGAIDALYNKLTDVRFQPTFKKICTLTENDILDALPEREGLACLAHFNELLSAFNLRIGMTDAECANWIATGQ